MPFIVIYRNVHDIMTATLYDNVNQCVSACKKYMKSIDIYDQEYQNKINQASNIFSLIDIIDEYQLEDIMIKGINEINPKELI